jgi:hypothetical protein
MNTTALPALDVRDPAGAVGQTRAVARRRQPPRKGCTMNKAVSLERILRDGLSAAQHESAGQVRAEHLSAEQLDSLAEATLAHLREQPGKPSHHEGWLAVSPRAARVMTWWSEAANLTETERRRLRSLRQGVNDLLEERNLIEQGPGQGSSVHVSSVGHGATSEKPAAEAEDVVVEDALEDRGAFGAWVLKLWPYVYDANRVFAAPDRRVYRWSVDDNDRSADMQHGQPAYLWHGDGDPLRAPGIWGVGWVTGPCESGTPDEGWMDPEAANAAKLFAVVEITLLDTPISRSVFLGDERLAGSEPIVEPTSGNPALLTVDEAAALAEYLRWTPLLPEPVGC